MQQISQGENKEDTSKRLPTHVQTPQNGKRERQVMGSAGEKELAVITQRKMGRRSRSPGRMQLGNIKIQSSQIPNCEKD